MLPPTTVLDGEVVIYANRKIDFEAAQSRAASTPARARRLAEDLPARLETLPEPSRLIQRSKVRR